MYEIKNDNNKCPQCNYPGVVTNGQEQGNGPYFGKYISGRYCGYCGHKEKVETPVFGPKIKVEETYDFQQAMIAAEKDMSEKFMQAIGVEISADTNCPNCCYPGVKWKGIYTPGEPCAMCGFVLK